MVPKGTPLALTYKYSIDGPDNEAGFEQNHVRYIRNVGNYIMPLDVFGSQKVEPSFGNLNIGLAPSSRVLLTWLGLPGVHLQMTTNLVGAVWQDHLETTGLSSTNWSIGSNPKLFFRPIKPGG